MQPGKCNPDGISLTKSFSPFEVVKRQFDPFLQAFQLIHPYPSQQEAVQVDEIKKI